MATSVAAGASIVPGFDSPVAGEEVEGTTADTPTPPYGETSAGVVEQPGPGPTQATDDAARDRFYDDEEGRA
jgi:hypothetical protein